MINRTLILLSVFLSYISNSYALYDPIEEGAGKISLSAENDAMYKNDKDYTNGVFLSWTPHDSRFNFLIAQELYTPKEKDRTPYPEDHPYAAWLYFKTSYKKLLSQNFLTELAVSVGKTGSDAFGEDVQNTVHEERDLKTFDGWDFQVPTRKGYIVDLELKYQIPFLSFDTRFLDMQQAISAYGSAGNIKNLGGGAYEVKLGYNVPRYSDKIDPNRSFRFYLFGKAQAQRVDSNYLLTGNNNLRDDDIPEGGERSSVKLERGVYLGSFGAVLGLGGLDITVYATHYTKEYEKQDGNDRIAGAMISWKY